MYRILLFIPPIEGVDFFKDLNNIQSLKDDIVTIGEEYLSQQSKQYGVNDGSADFQSMIKLLFASDAPELRGDTPTFVAFLGKKSTFSSETERQLYKEAEANGAAIYSIALGDNFFDSVPEDPGRYQGEIASSFIASRREKRLETAREKLTNLVKEIITNALHFFGLASARKVFISYCQRETADIAYHLYEELQKRHYKPFLDKNALQPTVDFQAHLMHELADSDILILLDSGGNRESKWCQEEINAALARGMAAVTLTWQFGATRTSYMEFAAMENIDIRPEHISHSTHYESNPPGFRHRLQQEVMHAILNRVDAIRARAQASKVIKLKELLEEMHSASSRLSFDQKGCMLKFDDITYKPIIGVPHAQDFYDSQGMPCTLAYYKTGVLDSHIRLIDWLACKSQISIQGLQSNEYRNPLS